jgi:hypothetical protein
MTNGRRRSAYRFRWRTLLAAVVTVAGVAVDGTAGAAADPTPRPEPAAEFEVPAGTPVSVRPLVAAVVPVARTAGKQDVLTGVTPGNWRARLGRLVAADRSTRSVAGSAEGVVVAGTVRLPEHLELTGDLTIVAERILLASRTFRVTGRHALHLYPVTSLTVPDAGADALITMDHTGAAGAAGTPG